MNCTQKEELLANNYVLYTVNCGTPDPAVLPNDNTEKMGLLRSNVDQEYGKTRNRRCLGP